MLVLIFRTLILYGFVVFSIRLMGKRQIGELQPSELVVAIMISDLASVPMQSIDISLLNGLIPVLTLISAEIVMSFITLKSRKIRRFITGEPSIIIYNGQVIEDELEHLRFNLNDLLEELRISGYPNIADVHTAVLETNGQISIIPFASARTVTVKDLQLSNAVEEILPYMLISDGELNIPELKRSGKSEQWLIQELKKKNISRISDVFIASLDNNDELFIQQKNKGRRK